MVINRAYDLCGQTGYSGLVPLENLRELFIDISILGLHDGRQHDGSVSSSRTVFTELSDGRPTSRRRSRKSYRVATAVMTLS